MPVSQLLVPLQSFYFINPDQLWVFLDPRRLNWDCPTRFLLLSWDALLDLSGQVSLSLSGLKPDYDV